MMKNISGLGKVLVVDPDSKWINLLSQILKGDGYYPLVAHKGERAMEVIIKEHPLLILTEANLAGEINGYELTRRIREFSDMPIIFLAAQDEVPAVLRAFEAGADDYVTKPFDARVLLARIKARLKRSSEIPAQPVEMHFQHLTIHLASRQVAADNTPVYLTETEYNLLLELAKHHDQVLLHEYLLTAVWGKAYKDEVNYLRSYVHTLRRKLEKDPANPQLILSRAGVGYILVSNPSAGEGR